MFLFNVKNISKMMVALLATAVVTSFSVGTADACYGGAEGTKGCTSSASYDTSHHDEMTVDGHTFEGEEEIAISSKTVEVPQPGKNIVKTPNGPIEEETNKPHSECKENIKEVGENMASGSGVETAQ